MTTATGGYNGWSNKETWNANLWITNTESLYRLVWIKLEQCKTVSEIADNVEQLMWILWEGTTPDGFSLSPVNWVEIADGLIDGQDLSDLQAI